MQDSTIEDLKEKAGDMDVEEFNEEVKEIAKKSYLEGWKRRVGSDHASNITMSAAESSFERWWLKEFER